MFAGRKFDHIGIATNDLDATIEWFKNTLGCIEIGSFVVPDGTKCKFLKDSQMTYEIFQPITGVPEAVCGKIDHIAYVSENIEADYEFAQKNEYTITTCGISHIPTFWETGIRYIKVAAPTGEQVEFCQRL